MSESIFSLDDTNKHISSKIVVALERVSQSFKRLLWEKAKTTGLSPIQIQVLLFIEHHDSHFATVSYLAKEFNVTKATMSDAIKALHNKKLIRKRYAKNDKRTYQIILAGKGRTTMLELNNYADSIQHIVAKNNDSDLYFFYKTLTALLGQLHQANILEVQRSCASCTYFHSDTYCSLYEKRMPTKRLRIDCPEYVAADTRKQK
ncbi:MAG: MarR family transcriptional regulator [Flavobacteriaceae bacterium]|nr:MarR family transcriptional regulator [Flavobacteriaceae bacterium]